MRTSISTTSGSSSALRRTASKPSAGLADDVDVGLDREDRAQAAAHEAVVVGDQHAYAPTSALTRAARSGSSARSA